MNGRESDGGSGTGRKESSRTTENLVALTFLLHSESHQSGQGDGDGDPSDAGRPAPLVEDGPEDGRADEAAGKVAGEVEPARGPAIRRRRPPDEAGGDRLGEERADSDERQAGEDWGKRSGQHEDEPRS